MKFCSFCGNQNEDDAMFCSECGEKFVKNAVKPEKPEPVHNGNGNGVSSGNGESKGKAVKNSGDKKNNKGLTAFLVTLLSAFAVFTLFNFLICTDVINGYYGSSLEEYQTLIRHDILKLDDSNFKQKYLPDEGDGGKNPTVAVTDVPTEPATEAPTEAPTDEPSIWNPDNDPDMEKPEPVDTDSGQHYIVNVGKSVLNLRSDKSTSSKILKTIPNNTEIVITEIEDGWGYTAYSGKSGWVSMDYVIKK